MNSRYKRITTTMVLFLIFSVAQVYVQVSFARPNSKSVPAARSEEFAAILTTRGNQPITINGATVISGATVLNDATIETPDQVGATINLGSLGVLDIAPKTRLTLRFDYNGSIKVTLIQGCAILRARKNTTGEVDTPMGYAGATDPATGGVLDICFPPGTKSPTVNVGAGAGSADAAPGVGPIAGTGTALGVIIGAIGGGAMITSVVTLPCNRGRNPSPQHNTRCR
jgi:hypothetical protein